MKRRDATAREQSALLVDTIPETTVRGVGSSHSVLAVQASDTEVIQVCDGTSCRLAGAAITEQNLRRYGHQCQKVYCLGYCDRSPNVMDEFDQTHQFHRSKIRCVSPQAIITERILKKPVPVISDAMKAGVYKSLSEAFSHKPEQVISLVESAGERGRGGSGHSTAAKWKAAANVEADQRYVIANGDEGDPGSFVDRVLMEEDPHSILEGMILCGYAIGADKGFVYIRAEYPQANRVMQKALRDARAEGVLGKGILGTDFGFDITIVEGTGIYVRGEEIALIKSIEELRGEVQPPSPFPMKEGLYGKPTVVNNVETLMNIPYIILNGPEKYRALGTLATSGTKAICLNYGFALPGIVEVEFGVTFREVIEDIGGGGKDGTPLSAVLVGGPMGTLLLPEGWDIPICFDALAQNDVQLGHGGMIAIPHDCNFRDLLVHLVEFMVHEARGKCEPDRLGSQALLNVAIDESRTCRDLEKMLGVIEAGSLCAFGHYTPGPIRTLVTHFGSKIIGEGAAD